MMKLFKASLWSSVLTLCSVVSAAPQSLLAGRVPSPDSVEFLRNIQSLSPFLSSAGLPAFSLVRAVPAVHQPAQTVREIKVSPAPAVITNLGQVEEQLPARYNFGYSVSDLESGDSKSRQESRDGDVVTGSYSVADPDGRIRTVTYTADSEHGFQAKVTYDGKEGPVAIPVNSQPEQIQPTQPAQPVIVAKDVEEQEPEKEEVSMEVKSAEMDPEVGPAENVDVDINSNVPALFNRGLRLSPRVPTVINSLPHVFTSPHSLNNFHHTTLPHHVFSPTPRLVSSLPGLFNTVQAVPSLQALLHNNVQAVHGLPQGVAVRAGAAPLDLSQFTFLSNGQVIG